MLHFIGQTIMHLLVQRELFLILMISINLMKCEARFAIFQNREIFPGVTLVQKLCHWNGLSMCIKNWCPKTEFAYLIGCHNGNHFELILKNPCWQAIKCANSVFEHQLLKLIERPLQRHNFCTKVTPGKFSLFWKMTKRASHFIKLIIFINIRKSSRIH